MSHDDARTPIEIAPGNDDLEEVKADDLNAEECADTLITGKNSYICN